MPSSVAYRLLRALAAVGIVEEVENTRFALTPLGSYLRGDIAGSMRAYAIFLQEPWNRLPWAELLHCVRTGREAFEAVHGIRYFDYLARHPELEPIFNAAMSSNGWMRTNGLVATYDFAGMHTVVDVGGGRGGC